MKREKHISLGLVLHNHQPVGQIDAVFEETYARAYEPTVAALERHPGVRAGLHYTGSLLDWLFEHKPDFIRRIRDLVARGQVEVLSGGYYEPILPSIPDDDKHAQIEKLTETVRREFGYDPIGMWLAERVWEPTLPTHLAGAGIAWTVVDDAHFKMVGLSDADLTGYFATEDNGNMVGVFGNSQQLRYTIPWLPVQDTIDYCRREAVPHLGKVLVAGDDGEKFGAWPGTYEHCWSEDKQSGWVDQFFSALEENAAWLHTVKLGDHVRDFPAIGRVYLPTASYNEMMEWALPAGQGQELADLQQKLKEAGSPATRFMKGGFWRNFMAKYPEVNTQHKKMLRVHDLLAQARAAGGNEALLEQAQEDLWRGQSNDTYWHGLFGGMYMTDVRARVHAYLLRAEQAAERVLYGSHNWIKPETVDFDCDSLHELLIEGNALNLYIDLAEGGSIFEWDLRAHNFDLASTLSRRPEGYHMKIREAEEKRRQEATASKATKRSQQKGGGEEPVPLHEGVRAREEGLDRYLTYDKYRRNCMIEHWLGPGTTLESFRDGTYNEEGDFVNGVYQAEVEPQGNVLHVVLQRDGQVNMGEDTIPVRVSKRLIMKAGSPNYRVKYTIENLSDDELTGVFASEWNINLLGGGHNPSAYYRIEGVELDDAALDSTGEVRNVTELAVGNSWLEIELGLKLNHEATFWRFPIETVSGSEAGFERNYQGSSILLQWLLKLSAGDSLDIELTWTNQGNTAKPEHQWLD
jgi:alpha-amylase